MIFPDHRLSLLGSIHRLMTGFPMVTLLLALYWMMAVSGGLEKSTTFDEILHLTAGYSYWLTGDFRLHPPNGIFPQRWAAVPLLFGDFTFPSLDQPDWWRSNAWGMGYQFFYYLGNNLEAMLQSGRTMIACLGAALGFVVYSWSRSLFVQTGGIISLILFRFCQKLFPNG